MTPAYITALGTFLPGPRVANHEMEEHLGRLGGRRSRLGGAVLRQNGIRGRHYAILDKEGPWTNARLAARALDAALESGGMAAADVDFLATATTQNDVLVPGFASMVHGESQLGPIELASFQSVCASVLMALKAAALQVGADGKRAAAVIGSEFASRFFQPGFYDSTSALDEDGRVTLDAEFLRWTLSDGASAAIVEPCPPAGKLALRLDWIELRSFADRFATCMWGGGRRDPASGEIEPWNLAPTIGDAARRGDFVLRQDFRLLPRLFPVWVGEFLRLMSSRAFAPSDIDWVVCHYSAESLKREIWTLLERAAAMIPSERWFSILPATGNIGAASFLAGLEALTRSGELRRGQRILGVVPESGRCLIGFAHMTVVEGGSR